MDIQEMTRHVDDMKQRMQAVLVSIDIEALKNEYSKLENQMSQPDFWSDQQKAQHISREAGEMKNEIDTVETLRSDVNDLTDLIALAKEDESSLPEVEEALSVIQKKLEEVEKTTFFSGKHDASNAILSFHAGAGGTDAQDWAGMILRMMMRYAEKKGWAVEILDQSLGEEAGIKSTTISVKGRYAYGHLKAEAGVHRLVRISPFDAEGMRHTSFALIEVLPELTEVTFDIDPNDLRIDTFASGGAGGQSVNTTNSAVRITHIPTNIVVSCQNERSQQQNKETAMKVLSARLYQRLLDERAEKLEELKGGHTPVEWGSQIRSYVLHPYKMVKDHRTKYEVQDVDAVLDGDLDGFVEAYLKTQL